MTANPNTGHAAGRSLVAENPADLLLSRLKRVTIRGPRSWTACCPAHDDKTPSLFIDQKDDGALLLKCFSGCSAADITAAVGLSMADLYPPDATRSRHQDKAAAPAAAATPLWTPVMPIPNDADPLQAHPKLGAPTAKWTYRDAKGKRLFRVYRFDTPDGKQFRPLSYWRSGDKTAWKWEALPLPRPLYNLDLLAKHAAAPVVLCEGEKAADAAATLMPDCVATTTPNGAQSPRKADWTPLAGRTVWIWPDNDEPGRAYAKAVVALLQKTNAQEIRVINLAVFGDALSESGSDAADLLNAGWTAGRMQEIRQAEGFFETDSDGEPEPIADEPPRQQEGSSFEVKEWVKGFKNGVYFMEEEPPRWICDPLRVTAQCCDDSGRSWGRLLEFNDPAGTAHAWTMPMRILGGDGTELRQELLDQGLAIAPGRKARELLTTYLQTARPSAFARCVERTGWYRGAFVLPDSVIGAPAAERVLFQTTGPAATPYCQAGSIDDWRQQVGALCVGNSRLILAVSAAFASMLLDVTGKENGGIHFRGRSSEGKTTILRAAASVFGPGRDFVENWRATDNGLEAIAAAHNDALLILDEIAQVDPRIAGDIAYMLANGQGKSRSNRQGEARARKHWRLLFLSSGELSLADHMQAAGKRAHAGQETRLIDVPADTGKYGAFEQLHGYSTGSEFAQALSAATMRAYGAPARDFLEKVTRLPMDAIESRAAALIKSFSAECAPPDASGQVTRIAERFALIAAGGELASALGVTGWNTGDAADAAKGCLNAAIAARGGHGPREEIAALEQVRLFFQQHGESRFTPWNDENYRNTVNRAGFRKPTDQGMEFLAFRETFKTEICKGLDAGFVARLLAERGLLYAEKSGKTVTTVHKAYGQLMRLYHFAPSILGDSNNAN